jgi:hypothetical protein
MIVEIAGAIMTNAIQLNIHHLRRFGSEGEDGESDALISAAIPRVGRRVVIDKSSGVRKKILVERKTVLGI